MCPLGSSRCSNASAIWPRFEVDGEIVHEATGAAILGHPLRAIVWLSEHLARCGQTLPQDPWSPRVLSPTPCH
jgi:2-keto-4-pentenoate hydratase